MSMADAREGERCTDCGHPTYLHRANGISQTVALDDPVPCYAVVETIVERDEYAGLVLATTFRYCYCECLYLIEKERSR